MRSLCAAKSAKGVGGRHVYSSAQGCDRVMMRGLLEHMPPPPPFGVRQRLLQPPLAMCSSAGGRPGDGRRAARRAVGRR